MLLALHSFGLAFRALNRRATELEARVLYSAELWAEVRSAQEPLSFAQRVQLATDGRLRRLLSLLETEVAEVCEMRGTVAVSVATDLVFHLGAFLRHLWVRLAKQQARMSRHAPAAGTTAERRVLKDQLAALQDLRLRLRRARLQLGLEYGAVIMDDRIWGREGLAPDAMLALRRQLMDALPSVAEIRAMAQT